MKFFRPFFITLACASISAVGFSAEIHEHKTLEYFPVKDVRLTSGPMAHAQQLGIDYLLALDADRLLAPYLKEAGLTPKAENYTNWENTGLDGHIGGHYLSALSYMYAATGNKEIGQRLDYMLSELKRCQDASPDGYLSGVPGGKAFWADLAAGNFRAGGFDINGKWVPLYNIHKIYAGLKDAYLQAGKPEAREMLVRLTDWMTGIVSGLSDEQIQDMLRSEHGGLNEIFADVAVITGDGKYMTLARQFSHRALLEPLSHGENRLTGMHANTQIPKVIGFKRIADIDGNTDWERAVEYFWNDVVNNRSVSIGGNSVREHFHSPDDFSSMLESEQGPETCNTYNMLRLTKMLYESSGDPKYLDFNERALFNHILSAQNHEQGGYVYFTPMRSGHYRVYSQPQTSFWCCVGSGMENQARYGEYIYAHKGNDIYVDLFVPSTLTWKGNTIEQLTDFPASDATTLVVTPARAEKFALNIRIPGWTTRDGITVTVNGKEQKVDLSGDYVTLSRKWKKGDKVTARFPMHLSVEQLPDKSANYSILYGPVVLAASLGTEGQEGLFADDSRMGHAASGPRLPLQEMPMIVGDAADIVSYVTPVEGEPLTFKLSHVYPAQYDGMTLVPFASLNECRYMVYWPVLSEAELDARLARIAREQAEAQALLDRTADMVTCGEQQPESDHFITMEKTDMGTDHDRHWRRANPDGWFSYRMKTSGKNPTILRVSYLPAQDRAATVWVGDTCVGTISPAAPGAPAVAEFPVAINADTAIVTVRSASPSPTPNIYEVRLMTEEK